MSDIQKLEDKLIKLKSKAHFDTFLPKGSSWLSKKLLSMLAIVAALIWLGRDNLALSINGIILVSVVYIIAQAVNDAVHSVTEAWVRRTLIQAMAVDGLNEEERKALGVPTTTKTETTTITG
jgi:hypothetical protein